MSMPTALQTTCHREHLRKRCFIFVFSVLAAWLTGGLSALQAAEKFNVLFVAVDDLRPELGCYGNQIIKTPNIDRLAARSLLFERAYCAQAVCSPSRTAIMTGLRPDTTKVWDLNTHFRAAVPDCITLPQRFKAEGWRCEALGKIYHPGFEDGLSWSVPHWYPGGRTVDTDPNDWSKKIIVAPNSRSSASKPAAGKSSPNQSQNAATGNKGPAFEISDKTDEELNDGATANEAVARLATLKSQGQPFFLAVGFLKPHLPFVAPKQYWDLYDPDQIPEPATDRLPKGTASFVGHTNGELHSYAGVPKGNPIPADYARTLRHGYYACVSYTDAQIGRVLDALDKQGLSDNTIIVLWGDHGWQLGDHGLWHKHTNFEIATRSPLLISIPGSASRGQHCAAPVEFVDVYPTLTELCGLAVDAGLEGKSLKPFLDQPDAAMLKPAISVYPRTSPDHGGALMGYSVRTEGWRATFWRKRNGSEVAYTELYDEQNDPAETINLAEQPEHAERLKVLAKYLPPAGSDAPNPNSATKPSKTTKKPDPNAGEDRASRFARLYPGKEQLTLAEYLAGQGQDKIAAQQRFNKFDTDQDGLVTRAEFISGGSAK